MWWMMLVACSAGDDDSSSADTAHTGLSEPVDVTGDWGGGCTEADGTEWTLDLSFAPRTDGDFDTDWALARVVPNGDPSFLGTARAGWEGSVLTVAAGVMDYTTGYVLDVNLDLALSQAGDALTGSASSFFDASCSVERRQ